MLKVHVEIREVFMRKQKRWVGVVALTAVTVAALFGGIGLRKSFAPIPAAELSVEGYSELGIREASQIVDNKGNVTGYRVVAETKGFAEEPIVLAVTFNNTADTITAVEVVSHQETEGYGSKIMDDSFLKQFIGVELPVYLEGKKSQVTAVPTKAPAPTNVPSRPSASGLQDGIYVERALEPENGYTSEVVLTVEGGAITKVVWDAYDENGSKKSVLSETGEYVMTPDGPTWAEQAKALAAYVIEHQGIDGLTVDENGKTDAVSGVSISIGEFIGQVTTCLTRAAQAIEAKPETALGDGIFTVRSEEADNGYYNEVSLTVTSGRISSLVWDAIDEAGNRKSVLSETGEYTMTPDGPTWADQAKAIATYVIEHQGLESLSLNEEGKTDAVATVSISVGGFAVQVENCLKQAAEAVSKLQDGVYVERASEAANGYISEVVLTVRNGVISEVVWDAYDENGSKKSVLSENGEYVMTPDGPTWADQAKALAAYVIEHQGTDGLTIDENGKTDAVSGVSISIGEFIEQVTTCLTRADQAKDVKPETQLGDGIYQVRSEEPENGYYSEVSLTVAQGRITSVIWDQVDENGNRKSVLSETGEYVMTPNGPTWAKQAEAIATYVLEHQGISGLTLNEEGKTDAVAMVSISVGDFVSQVEECLKQAASEAGRLQNGLYVERAAEAQNGYYSEVTLAVEDGKISSVIWECYDEEGKKKSVLAKNGEYVMTEDGLTWDQQAEALAAYVLENQGVSGLSLNEEGKTDAVSGVSISISEFVTQVSAALSRAEGAKTARPEQVLTDGIYQATAKEPHNGYTSQVTLAVRNGRISEVVWDAFDADGNSKRLLADQGEYVMTPDGSNWREQADVIATYAIERQGIHTLTLNEEGKTDAVATVSISVNEFTALVEECLSSAEQTKGGTDSPLQDGIYVERAAQAENGYTSQFTMVVEGGVITKVTWDAVDDAGNGKAGLSREGRYVMTDNGMLWADQAEALAAYLIEHQGLEGLNFDENGKTDAVSGVSISIQDFVGQAEACLTRAAAAKTALPNVTLSDGTYTAQSEQPDNSGYTSKVTLTVTGGRISQVLWDCVDAQGNTKRVLSEQGEYVMTEHGPIWAEQANALATYVIEKQGMTGLTTDENGKTDAIATVSISIGEFVAQVEDCLKQAAGGSGVVVADPTSTPSVTETPEPVVPEEGTKVDGISGASYSSRGFVNGINNAYKYICSVLEK